MKEIKRYYAHIVNGNEIRYSINDNGDLCRSENLLKLITDHKAVVETLNDKLLKTSFVMVDLNKRIEDLLLVADHRWDELKKAEKRIEELEHYKLRCDLVDLLEKERLKELTRMKELQDSTKFDN